MSNRDEILKKIKKGLPIDQYTEEEIKIIMTPIGKALYSTNGKLENLETLERNESIETSDAIDSEKARKTEWNPQQRIKCRICGSEYLRGNRSKHEKTQKHQTYCKLNEKFRKILFGE